MKKTEVKKTEMRKIGIRLKDLRRQNNYKQVQLAHQLKCSIASYCKMEIGYTDITYTRLEKLAEIYGLKLHELFIFNDEDEGLKVLIKDQRDKINGLEENIIQLQKKIICLHEELRECSPQ